MATKDSDLRKKYGQSKAPLPATKVFKKDMEHFKEKGIDASAWIIFDETRGVRVSANTYSGNAGKNFKANELPIPSEEKDVTKLTKDYTEVAVADCPIAEPAKKASKPKKSKAEKAETEEAASA